jgi:hypothetical protein
VLGKKSYIIWEKCWTLNLLTAEVSVLDKVNSATDYNVRFKVFLTVTADYCLLECDDI